MAFIWLLIFLGTVEFVDGYTVNGKIEFTKTNIIINENNDKRTFEFINIDHIKIVYDSYEGGGHKYVVSRWQGIENEEGIGSIHIYGIDKSMSSYNYVARNANTIVMINKLLEEYKSLGIRIELQTI